MRVAGGIGGVILVVLGILLVFISVTAVDEPGAQDIAAMFYGGVGFVIVGAGCIALAQRASSR